MCSRDFNFNLDSAWYHNHQLYRLGNVTHGMWLSDHAEEFGLNIPELEFEDEWSEEWIDSMRIAFRNGWVRVQKHNNIATISVLDFSDREKDRIFAMFADYPQYFSECNYIEVVTLDWETLYSDYDDEYEYRNGNYVNGESVSEIMEKLG